MYVWCNIDMLGNIRVGARNEFVNFMFFPGFFPDTKMFLVELGVTQSRFYDTIMVGIIKYIGYIMWYSFTLY